VARLPKLSSTATLCNTLHHTATHCITRVPSYIYVYIYAYIYIYMSTYTSIYIHTYIHTAFFHTHIYIYTHIYIKSVSTCLLVVSCSPSRRAYSQTPPPKKKKQVWVPNINWGVFLLVLVIQTALTALVYMTRDSRQDSMCGGFCGSWIKCFISTFSYVWHLRCVAFCMWKFSFVCGILFVCLWSHV